MTTSHAAVELFSTSILSNHKVRSRHERYISILAVKKIPYVYHDLASDEEAKSRWRRKARDPQIPGLLVHNEWRGTFEEFEESIEFGELDLFLKIDPIRAQHEAQLHDTSVRSAGSSTTPSEAISSSSDSYVSASSSKAPNRSVSHPVKSIARLAQPKAPSQNNLAPALPFAPVGSGRRKDHDAETFLSSLGISDMNLTEEELNEILEAGKSSTSEGTNLGREETGKDTNGKYPSSLGIGNTKPPVQRTYIPSADAGVKPLQFAKMGNGNQRSATSSTSPLHITPSARYNESHKSSKALAAEAQASISSRSFSSLKLRDAVSRGDKLEDAFRSTKAASSNGHKEHIVGREDLDELMSSLALDNVEMTEEEAEAFLLDGSIPSGLDAQSTLPPIAPSMKGRSPEQTVIKAEDQTAADLKGETTSDHPAAVKVISEVTLAPEKTLEALAEAEKEDGNAKSLLVNSSDENVTSAAEVDTSTPKTDVDDSEVQTKGSDAFPLARDQVIALGKPTEAEKALSTESDAVSLAKAEKQSMSFAKEEGNEETAATAVDAPPSVLIDSSEASIEKDDKADPIQAEKDLATEDVQQDFMVSKERETASEARETEDKVEVVDADTPPSKDTHLQSKDTILAEIVEERSEPTEDDARAETVPSAENESAKTTESIDGFVEEAEKRTSTEVSTMKKQRDGVSTLLEHSAMLDTPSKRPIPLQIETEASNFSVLDNLDLLDGQTTEKGGLGLMQESSVRSGEEQSTAKLEPAHVISEPTKLETLDSQSVPLPNSATSMSSPSTKDVPAVEFASPTTIPSSPSAAAALSSSPQTPANLSPVTARRRQSTSASRSSSRRAMDVPRRGSHNSMQSEASSSSPHHSNSPSYLTSPVMSPKSSDDRKSPKSAAKKFFNKMRRSSSNSKKNEEDEEEAHIDSSYSYDPNQKRISAILREADAAMEGMGDDDLDVSHDSIQSDHAFNLQDEDKVTKWTASSPIAQD